MIQAEIDQFARTLAISLGVGLLALYVLLLPLMVGTTRTLRRQNEQLTEQAAQLSELLEREQATVAELRELDRMKGDFVAASSHELRSPLTSILGYARMLRTGAADDPIAHEAVDAIERQGNRMLRLVMNLLTESRIESGRSESPVVAFDVAALMREVAGDFHLDGDRIHVEVARGRRRGATAAKVADILVNLMDNALKYSRPGTPVTLAASVAGDTLSLSVRDEGPGIDPDDLPRIFDRFYQADQSATRLHGGVGLGLHIVKGLVDAMGRRRRRAERARIGPTFTRVVIPMVGGRTRSRRSTSTPSDPDAERSSCGKWRDVPDVVYRFSRGFLASQFRLWSSSLPALTAGGRRTRTSPRRPGKEGNASGNRNREVVQPGERLRLHHPG